MFLPCVNVLLQSIANGTIKGVAKCSSTFYLRQKRDFWGKIGRVKLIYFFFLFLYFYFSSFLLLLSTFLWFFPFFFPPHKFGFGVTLFAHPLFPCILSLFFRVSWKKLEVGTVAQKNEANNHNCTRVSFCNLWPCGLPAIDWFCDSQMCVLVLPLTLM